MQRSQPSFTDGGWDGHFHDGLDRLVGTDQRVVQGLSTSPELPKIPTVAAVPQDLAPPADPVALPDTEMARRGSELVPTAPTQRMTDAGDETSCLTTSSTS